MVTFTRTRFTLIFVGLLLPSCDGNNDMGRDIEGNPPMHTDSLPTSVNTKESHKTSKSINLRKYTVNTSGYDVPSTAPPNGIKHTPHLPSDLETDNTSWTTFNTSPSDPLGSTTVGSLSSEPTVNTTTAPGELTTIKAHDNWITSVPAGNFTSSPNPFTDNFTSTPSQNSSILVSTQFPSVVTATDSTLSESTTAINNSTAFNGSLETTTLQPGLNFTNSSKTQSNTSDSGRGTRNSGVVFGAILGATLGASLLTLIGYLICGRKKPDSFSHRRLYDDRNEPVLRLDNTSEPYDMNFGESSYYNPAVTDDAGVYARPGSARDGIPMGDIPPLRPTV
ncbi:mucin-15 [Tachyglossus aculeatus]|uniref:mucin-15 n=1 Tax=Tachyglossus aculeatus TaxID=9261 RepID=UPI0018F6C817|nr:mucin-15 [Tachyglossus aculeatus]